MPLHAALAFVQKLSLYLLKLAGKFLYQQRSETVHSLSGSAIVIQVSPDV